MSELWCPLAYLTNNALWVLAMTSGTFFLGKSFKTDLQPIFIFGLIVGLISFFVFWTQVPLFLLYYAGFNYLIQFIILVLNIKNKWTLEQGLFGIYFFGGVGSLIAVGLFNYQALGFYLCFYYCILIFGALFGERINRFRDLHFQ